MRKDWEIKKLGEVSNFQRGLTYSRKDTVDYSDNVVLRATNIDLENSCLDFTELKYISDDFHVKENKKLVKGGLLICLSSGSKKHLGKVALVTDDYNYAFGGFIGQIIPNKEILSQYLFYNLVSEKYKTYISELTDGININNLKSIDLKAFEIPIPPLKTQQQIVALLDKAFTAIDQAKANAQQNLINAKQLFESYLQNVFENKGDDWVEKEWNELIEIRSGRNQKEVLNPNGKYPILGSAGKVMNYANKYICEANTTIIGRKGTINNPLFITTRFWNVDTAFGLQVGEKLKSKFLYYFCKSFDFTEMDKGSGRPSLVKTDLLKIKMSYPSISEQEQIIIKIDIFHSETKKLEVIYQQKIDDLEELKKSVLQKAFNGELTQKELV